MKEKEKRLKQIEIENYIWIIYFFIIGLCLYGNYFEKKFFLYNDIVAKEKYRNISILIFIIAVVIYFYFFLDNYNDIKDISIYDSLKKRNLSLLNFIGSSLVLISGIIYLYIAISDTELETEIAFN